jgi:hypothetical protein
MLDVTPSRGRSGMEHNFFGMYNLYVDALLLSERGGLHRGVELVHCRLDHQKPLGILASCAI